MTMVLKMVLMMVSGPPGAGPPAAGGRLRVLIQPRPRQLAVGDTLRLECGALGRPLPRYQWHHNGAPLPNASRRTLTVRTHTALQSGPAPPNRASPSNQGPRPPIRAPALQSGPAPPIRASPSNQGQPLCSGSFPAATSGSGYHRTTHVVNYRSIYLFLLSQ